MPDDFGGGGGGPFCEIDDDLVGYVCCLAVRGGGGIGGGLEPFAIACLAITGGSFENTSLSTLSKAGRLDPYGLVSLRGNGIATLYCLEDQCY